LEKALALYVAHLSALIQYKGAVKSLARPGRKQATATENFDFHLFYVFIAALLVGRSRDRSPVVSLGIFSVVPSDKTMCPEVDSASENEYQGFVLG
jgi:hypothetical protein